MKIKFGIGQKMLMVVVALLIIFTVGLALLVGSTSFNNLTWVKNAELNRMSQVLAGQVAVLGQNVWQVARSFEDDEQIAQQITLITSLGPYYSDPGSYYPDDFAGAGAKIDNADQIYTFQAYLNLVRALQSSLQFNDLSSISFYMGTPFNMISAKPVLAFRLSRDNIYMTQFESKGNAGSLSLYRIPQRQFHMPAADYFDISSAYSALPENFYAENKFVSVASVDNLYGSAEWLDLNTARTQIIVKDGIPIIQTFYPVQLPLAHYETWEEKDVVVGVAVVEKQLEAAVVASLKQQLGLDVGFVQGDRLLINSIQFSPDVAGPTLETGRVIDFNKGSFYFARQPVKFDENPSTGLDVVIFSPASELTELTGDLRSRIVLISVVAIATIGLAIYLVIRYLVTRPLKALTDSARLISAGDLSQRVTVQSQDEVGLLGTTFNAMAAQLEELIGSLESKVAVRTERLAVGASLGERFSAILDFNTLLEEVVEQIQRNFQYSYAHIYLLDEKKERLIVVAGSGDAGKQMKANGHSLSVLQSTSLVVRAYHAAKIVQVDDVKQVEDWLPNPLLPDTRSEMAVPIMIEGEVMGVLDAQQNRVAGFDEGDVSLLRTLANQVAVAIRNARLFATVENALTEARMARDRYIEQTWDKHRLAQSTDSYSYRYNQPGVSSLPEAVRSIARAQAVAQEAPAMLSFNADDLPTNTVIPAATLVAPVNIGAKTIGSLQLHRLAEGEEDVVTWGEQDMAMVQAILEQVVQAAENLRLFNETRELAGREQTIREITGKLRSAPNLNAVLEIAARELGQRLNVPHVVLELGNQPQKPVAVSPATEPVAPAVG